METLQDRDIKLSWALGSNISSVLSLGVFQIPERIKLLVTMIAFPPALTPAGKKAIKTIFNVYKIYFT